jgi:aspartyl-tRNA(Asn)/glutamyl-tRNA(Gln) amidotransferase subunit C
MSISRREVEQVAKLAKLALGDDELAELTKDLGSILSHMEELGAADVASLAPMGGVSEHPAPYREDVTGADALHKGIEAFAPDWKERFFTVPRLAALDADALGVEGSSA